MEHIEQAGVHSGDSSCSLPPISLSPQDAGGAARADPQARARAERRRPDEHPVRDPERHHLRAGGQPARLAHRAVRLQGHRPAARQDRRARHDRPHARASMGMLEERVPPYYSVKEAVFPFAKFPEADPILGPEMKSTGEVMGTGRTFGEAYAKAQAASGVTLPRSRRVPDQRARARQGRRRGAGAASCSRAASSSSPPSGTARALDRRRHRLPARQQGARGPPAHRRHDQERRDRPDRQHHRGQAGDPRVQLDPPRGGARTRDLLHDAGGRAWPPARRSTTSTRSR